MEKSVVDERENTIIALPIYLLYNITHTVRNISVIRSDTTNNIEHSTHIITLLCSIK